MVFIVREHPIATLSLPPVFATANQGAIEENLLWKLFTGNMVCASRCDTFMNSPGETPAPPFLTQQAQADPSSCGDDAGEPSGLITPMDMRVCLACCEAGMSPPGVVLPSVAVATMGENTMCQEFLPECPQLRWSFAFGTDDEAEIALQELLGLGEPSYWSRLSGISAKYARWEYKRSRHKKITTFPNEELKARIHELNVSAIAHLRRKRTRFKPEAKKLWIAWAVKVWRNFLIDTLREPRPGPPGRSPDLTPKDIVDLVEFCRRLIGRS